MQQGPASQTSEMNKEEMAKLGGHWFQNNQKRRKTKNKCFLFMDKTYFAFHLSFLLVIYKMKVFCLT